MDIPRIQQKLDEQHIDGWLLYGFRDMNVIATRLLRLPPAVINTRRYYYFIPAHGEPKKLVHRIEADNLDSLPGEKAVYSSWQSLGIELKNITEGARVIAMEYSEHNAIPSIALADAGTVDLVRFIGKEVVSSANLVQEFDAVLTGEQIESHQTAAKLVRQCIHNAFDEMHTRITRAGGIGEYTVQQFLVKRFDEHNLTSHHPALVAVNRNTANPHYLPTKAGSAVIRTDDLIMIDLSGKLNTPESVYADLTWMGYTGEHIPEEYENMFSITARARDAAVQLIRDRLAAHQPVAGCEVDDAARAVINDAGFGDSFIHRTGHSIGEELHGRGANPDNFETHDYRRLIPRTCFSIEPGIYTGEFGIRTEINVLITPGGEVLITGGDPQQAIRKI